MNKKIRTIFDSWTECSSYLLGFWLADGWIWLCKHKSRQSYSKVFSLVNTDEQIMLWAANILDVKLHTPSSAKLHYKRVYKLHVYSDNMFDFCYNVTHSTSKSDKEICLPSLPDNVLHHFVRGFFDGDGSIHVKHYSNRHGKLTDALQTSFTAGRNTGEFLEKLLGKLQTHIPIGSKKIYHGHNKKLQFNQYDSMLLCEWMYQDASIFMKRKKNIWDLFDKDRLRNSQKYFSNKV